MNKHKINFPLAALAAVGALSGALLMSCDNDKLLTKDFEEEFLVKEITLDVTDQLPLPVGMDTTITYKVEGPEGADLSIIFMSSDENVATVDQNGTIRGIAPGDAVITCTLPIGFGPNATVAVNVVPELIQAESIEIENTTSLGEEGKIYETDEIQLSAAIFPEDHTYSRLVWYSDDESIATVDNTGLVKCLSQGETIIKAVATDRSGCTGAWKIKIDKYISVERIEIDAVANPVQLLYGPFELGVRYFPEGATKGSVTWESSDAAVATVHRGVVTPTGFGKASITGTCNDTGQSVTVDIDIPEGWYVWDAKNGFLGMDNATSWISSNESPLIEDGVWRVWLSDPESALTNTGKWRRDIKLNCSNNNKFSMHSSRPVLALRTTIPRGGDNTWDVRDSGNPHDKNGVDLPDGTRLISIDLTEKFNGWGAGFHEFNLFQLKVADIPNGNVDKTKPYYDVIWARTFTSKEEAIEFATQDATANPHTF